MFQRIATENWAETLPIVAFFVSFTVFATVTIVALRMNRQRRERMAALPLEDGEVKP